MSSANAKNAPTALLMLPDLFRRLKPLYGARVDQLWVEYQLGDGARKREIEELLLTLAIRKMGIGLGDERLVLHAPPATLIGEGEYELGMVLYPGLAPYPFRIKRGELLRHLFVLGPTGTGKSTLLFGLLQQLLIDGQRFMVFDFKRNYRSLVQAREGKKVLVLTIGRAVAPVRLNVLLPPEHVPFPEWVELLADLIGAAYLLLQGARNVLKEALLQAEGETLRQVLVLLKSRLASTRPGSRTYSWLESAVRSVQELATGAFGGSLCDGARLDALLSLPVVFELQGLGDDQKRFFCLYVLGAISVLRKNDTAARETLQHVLVFDESHHVFPRDPPGELGIPSRLAREVREYGEAIVSATQQSDVAESLIANAGFKVILRCDFPRDVDFASKLFQLEPKWFPKLQLGTGVVRMPVRYYNPFLFSFSPQPLKNTIVTDAQVRERWLRLWPDIPRSPSQELTQNEEALLRDVAAVPISPTAARYARLSWNPKTGNLTKQSLLAKGLAYQVSIVTVRGKVTLIALTASGTHLLRIRGIAVAAAGKGGVVHEFWRGELRHCCTAAGYEVESEHQVFGGAVDLYAHRGSRVVFVEIETGKGDVVRNIEKCRKLPGTIVFFFTETSERERYTALLTQGGMHAFCAADLPQFTALLR